MTDPAPTTLRADAALEDAFATATTTAQVLAGIR